MMNVKKNKGNLKKINDPYGISKAPTNTYRPNSDNGRKPINKLKKNSSENGLLKTKITNLEQNLNDQERILKNLMDKVNKDETKQEREKSSIIKLSKINNTDNKKIIEFYEQEISGMKKNLNNVMEENAYYKKILNNQNKSNERDLDYEKEKKIFVLEQNLRQKELIIEEKDTNYRLQMNNLNERILEFQKLLGRLSDCESEIEELNKKYEFKENEFKKMKQFYEEKIERQKKTQFEQKKEWTLVYNELFEELNFVKKDLENINQKSFNADQKTRKINESYRKMSNIMQNSSKNY